MVDFRVLEYQEKRVLVFDVSSRPIGLSVQLDGVAWWYESDSLIPMPDNVRYSIYKESGFDFSGSICAGATLSDLDESAVELFRSKWIKKSGNKRLANLSGEQILRDCSAVTDDGVTYAALILFGKHSSLTKYLPQSEIVFEYRSSNASGPANQREEFRAGFFTCFDDIWNLINLRNDRQHYQDGLFIFDIPTFNERVIREAVLNAVSHRDYQMAGSVFIRQYPDHLVIENPGGLPNGITLENILDRQSPRNRRVAEILSLCGLVERSGQGMNIIYEFSIKEAKELPDFTGTDSNFVVISLNGLVINPEMLFVINRIGNDRMESLSTIDFLIINSLYHGVALQTEMKARINRLIDMGIVEHAGRSKYVLARSLYAAVGKTGTYTRLVGLDRNTNKELILKHIKMNGDNGTPFGELYQVLPSHSRDQIRSLVNELRNDGEIYCVGRTKSALWFYKK